MTDTQSGPGSDQVEHEMLAPPGHLDPRTRMRLILAVAGVLAAVVGAVAVILLTVVLPGEAPPVPAGAESPAAVREEIEQRASEEATSYGWVDPKKGTVRIPIDKAVEQALGAGKGGR